MNFFPSVFKPIGAALIVLGLSGCAATADSPQHKEHHPAGARSGSTAPMGGMMGGGMMNGGKMGMMDMKSMCEMHSKMMQKTPEERKAMMEAHMGQMSAEDMQKRMEMMNEKCK